MTQDDIKYLADTLMIENGFRPAQMPYTVNMDTLLLGYVCDKCKRPGAVIALSGIEEIQCEGVVINLIKARCVAKVEEHEC